MASESEVDVPKVGPVKKRTLVIIGGGFAVFLAWRYYAASSGLEEASEDGGDPGFEDDGTIPAVDGATDWYGAGGGSTGDGTASEQPTIRTNAQWSQYARDQLLATDTYSGSLISSALGKYLSGKPLSAKEVEVVQAAIAYAGYPPVGTHIVVPGGDAKVTTAPTGLRVTGKTATTVSLAWNKMDGVDAYRAYRSGSATNVGTTDGGNTSIVIGGLQPNTAYSFQVAGDSFGSTPGPKSNPVRTTTAKVTLAKPSTPSVSSVTATTARVSVRPVSGATRYGWYLNNVAHGSSDGPAYTLQGLKRGTRYSLTVAADTATQGPGPRSGARSFTTKKK